MDNNRLKSERAAVIVLEVSLNLISGVKYKALLGGLMREAKNKPENVNIIGRAIAGSLR